MSAGGVSRSAEDRAVADFLTSAAGQPSGLVVEGEAGIGKTTLWLAAVEKARERGFRVLSARAGQAESMMAYAAVADMLAEVEPGVLAGLPELQRLALDRVLLRAYVEGPATNQHVVAAALLSIVECLAAQAPVLLAIDDVQWLDTSSNAVVAFAARRLKRPVGVLVTERCQPDRGTAASWLQLSRPDGTNRVCVRPMSLGGLHTLISAKFGRALPRPTMVAIAEVSGGNPFYALELARAIEGQSPKVDRRLPGTLSELVRLRIGQLDDDVRGVLLAAACVADPTVKLLAQATDSTVERVVAVVEGAEADGIISIDGNRVRFSHPLLATGVYTDATPASRRAIHRALAAIETQPELKARHLALAATSADEATLQALDAAAVAARDRGATAAAAELLDLAIKLGGDTPLRRILAASHHFQAGDIASARVILETAVAGAGSGMLRALALNLLAGIRIFDNRFTEAADLLKRALNDARNEPAVMVQTLMVSSFVGQAIGRDFDESLCHARQAVDIADKLGVATLLSQALAWWVNISFLYGSGLDEMSLRRALELEDPASDVPTSFRASVLDPMVLAWTGRLDEAHTRIEAARQRCIDFGAERDISTVVALSAVIDLWRGNFGEAAQSAEDALERAEQLGSPVKLIIPLTVRALVAAYAGREREARADAHSAFERAEHYHPPRLIESPTMILGFLEVSLGNYAAALTVLEPLLSMFDEIPGTEILTAWYVPDAVEAMVALGRPDEALPLIEALERNGRRLDRSWMLAVGARCRGMWLAAHGDVEAADGMACEAMAAHERLPMPFERARTQLLLGQLQRRQRHKEVAAATLGEALRAFEEMGTPLWAERARGELARTNVSPTRDLELTPSERRVAELVGSGMTIRDVAAALFISPKTVEHNLTRIYRKLGIRSRAELGRRIDGLTVRETPGSPGTPKR